jgi:hypothetical protein
MQNSKATIDANSRQRSIFLEHTVSKNYAAINSSTSNLHKKYSNFLSSVNAGAELQSQNYIPDKFINKMSDEIRTVSFSTKFFFFIFSFFSFFHFHFFFFIFSFFFSYFFLNVVYIFLEIRRTSI